MSDVISTLKQRMATLFDEAKKIGAEKNGLLGAKDEAGKLLAELAALGTREAEELATWIAGGRNGPKPQPAHERREAIADRLAQLRRREGNPAAPSLSDLELRESELISQIQGTAEKIEGEILGIIESEVVDAYRAAIEAAGAFSVASARLAASRTLINEQARTFASQRREELQRRALRLANESLPVLRGDEHLVSTTQIEAATAEWRKRFEALRA
jgi:hypothetical protein